MTHVTYLRDRKTRSLIDFTPKDETDIFPLRRTNKLSAFSKEYPRDYSNFLKEYIENHILKDLTIEDIDANSERIQYLEKILSLDCYPVISVNGEAPKKYGYMDVEFCFIRAFIDVFNANQYVGIKYCEESFRYGYKLINPIVVTLYADEGLMERKSKFNIVAREKLSGKCNVLFSGVRYFIVAFDSIASYATFKLFCDMSFKHRQDITDYTVMLKLIDHLSKKKLLKDFSFNELNEARSRNNEEFYRDCNYWLTY